MHLSSHLLSALNAKTPMESPRRPSNRAKSPYRQSRIHLPRADHLRHPPRCYPHSLNPLSAYDLPEARIPHQPNGPTRRTAACRWCKRGPFQKRKSLSMRAMMKTKTVNPDTATAMRSVSVRWWHVIMTPALASGSTCRVLG